jgi:transcription termination factor NusB
MDKTVRLEEALELIKQLSVIDKIRLIEQIAPQIEQELTNIQAKPRKSLRGLWRCSNVTELDIAQMRQQVWENFPREDV